MSSDRLVQAYFSFRLVLFVTEQSASKKKLKEPQPHFLVLLVL